MSRINSKKKGAKNERALASLFKQWTGYDFARSPSSGGLRWNSVSNTVGDIICTDERHQRRFPFTIETKFYNAINFEHLILDMKSSDIKKFWEQSMADAERAKKTPLLFMRYNAMPKETYFVMAHDWLLPIIKPQQLGFHVINHGTILILSTDFFSVSYKDTLYKIVKQHNKLTYGR